MHSSPFTGLLVENSVILVSDNFQGNNPDTQQPIYGNQEVHILLTSLPFYKEAT